MSLPCDSRLPRRGPSAFLNLICPGGRVAKLWGLMLASPPDGIWHVTLGIYLCAGWPVTFGIYLCGAAFTSVWIDAHIALRWHLGYDGLHVAFGSDLTESSDGMWPSRMVSLWN